MRVVRNWCQVFIGVIVALVLSGGFAMTEDSLAPESAAELFVPLAPGLVAEDFCIGPGGSQECLLENQVLSLRSGGDELPIFHDAVGQLYPYPRYESSIGLCGGNTELRERRLTRVTLSGEMQVFGLLRDRCDDGLATRASILGMSLDSINGSLYLAVEVRPDSCCGEPRVFAIVRISGLPTILDVVPEGPPGVEGNPGPTGPAGPPGPAGMDADAARVLALEQLAADQAAQILALQATLEQIENLPTIKKLLEKVEELEEATP